MLGSTFNEDFIDNMVTKISHKCDGHAEAKPLPDGVNGKQKMFKFEISTLYYKKCAVCHKDTNKSCSGCKDKKYYLCGKECQKIDWKRHPSTCTHKFK
jgi:hypothetical protein